MSFDSTAHLVFGIPVNSDDNPEFWAKDDDGEIVDHAEDIPEQLEVCEYGHHADAKILAILTVKDAPRYTGDLRGPGAGMNYENLLISRSLIQKTGSAAVSLHESGSTVDLAAADWHLVARYI